MISKFSQRVFPNNPSIWLVGSAFVLLQFFLQLSSGVVIGAIMHDMQLSPLTASILSSSFYFIYTCLQIPVGLVFDRKNPRPILTISALFCSLGCIIFAASHHLIGLYIGRSCIGIGSAFAFVGLTHLVRQHYPLRKFAFLIGLTETFSFLVTVLGITGMGCLILQYGWRTFINVAALFATIIACCCWRYIPNETKFGIHSTNYSIQLREVLFNKLLWINGLFIGLSFALVTVFGALWAIPFLQIKLNCTLRQASLINALFFLGTAFSCPLFGLLSEKLLNRNLIIISSCSISALLLLAVIYLPTAYIATMGGLMLILGLSCGAYLLAYPISNELAPSSQTRSTCAGFTNTLAIVTTPVLQPLIGYMLESVSNKGVYTLADYQTSLLILPGCLLTACILVCYLPGKKIEVIGTPHQADSIL